MTNLPILYEDNHLLVVSKPAGIATMGALSGPTVHSLAADYIKQAYNKPGRVFIGIVSRLDAMSTGVLVLARTSKAAARLSTQFAASSVAGGAAKIYLAAVEGRLAEDRGELTDHVRKDDQAHRMRVVGKSIAGAQSAQLSYVAVGGDDETTIVAVQLHSGRKHQIRLQFADRGHPILGDRKYGGRRPFAAGIALHSWRLRIQHPTTRAALWFESELPKSWQSVSRLLPNAAKLRAAVKDAFGPDHLTNCGD